MILLFEQQDDFLLTFSNCFPPRFLEKSVWKENDEKRGKCHRKPWKQQLIMALRKPACSALCRYTDLSTAHLINEEGYSSKKKLINKIVFYKK